MGCECISRYGHLSKWPSDLFELIHLQKHLCITLGRNHTRRRWQKMLLVNTLGGWLSNIRLPLCLQDNRNENTDFIRGQRVDDTLTLLAYLYWYSLAMVNVKIKACLNLMEQNGTEKSSVASARVIIWHWPWRTMSRWKVSHIMLALWNVSAC